MQRPSGRSRATVWRFCARPGLLVLRVWSGGSDRAGGCGALRGGCGQREGRSGREGLGFGSGPLLEGAGGAAGRRGAGGQGSLRFVCDSGGAWALSPLPGGAAVVRRGRGQPSETQALVPGCRRGDNRGRGPSFASLPTPAGAAPLRSPLSEGVGRRPQGAAALGQPAQGRGCVSSPPSPSPSDWRRAGQADTPRGCSRPGARTARVAVGCLGTKGGSGETVEGATPQPVPELRRGLGGGGSELFLAGVGRGASARVSPGKAELPG